MDIRCRKTECEYNNKYTCVAKDITILKNMECQTYIQTYKDEPDTTRTLYEKAPDYAPMRDSKTLCIACKANCIFNDAKDPKLKRKNNTCTANGITINTLGEKPLCITFCHK